MAKLAEVVDEVDSMLADSADREISTTAIGELLMDRLRTLDKIAYVRFASVYRDFQDVEAFVTELKDLLQRDSRRRTALILGETEGVQRTSFVIGT